MTEPEWTDEDVANSVQESEIAVKTVIRVNVISDSFAIDVYPKEKVEQKQKKKICKHSEIKQSLCDPVSIYAFQFARNQTVKNRNLLPPRYSAPTLIAVRLVGG